MFLVRGAGQSPDAGQPVCEEWTARQVALPASSPQVLAGAAVLLAGMDYKGFQLGHTLLAPNHRRRKNNYELLYLEMQKQVTKFKPS